MTSITDDNDNNRHQFGGSGEMKSSKKECTCEQNNVDNITEGINKVAILDDTSKCANCGKEGNSDDMNICNKCQMVKYCNAACKKKHRSKHKKACERRVAELHEEQLFNDIEPEECPICFQPMPLDDQTSVGTCCGKRICDGCVYSIVMSEGKDLCAFCRTPPTRDEKELIERVNKLMDKGNGEACFLLAGYYAQGSQGLPRDWNKAKELMIKAGELGCASGYYNLGVSYNYGDGVKVNKKKANYYFELAARGGSTKARHNLGSIEGKAGNYHRAMRHYIIAAKAGRKESLDAVKAGFIDGYVTKDEYANALRVCHERQKELNSDARDKAREVFED